MVKNLHLYYIGMVSCFVANKCILIYCIVHENTILYLETLQENEQYKNEYYIGVLWNIYHLIENLKKHNLPPEKRHQELSCQGMEK